MKFVCIFTSHQAAALSSSFPPAPPSLGPPAGRVDPPGLVERWGRGKDTEETQASLSVVNQRETNSFSLYDRLRVDPVTLKRSCR